MKRTDKESTLQLALRLFVICAVAAVLLSGVYLVTEGPIAQAKAAADAEAKAAVLPGASEFKDREDVMSAIAGESAFSGITGVYEDAGGAGFVIDMEVRGYKAGLCLTVGLSSSGEVTGAVITEHNETSGLGSKAAEPGYLDQYIGAAGEVGEYDAITAATKTSVAVKNAINTALALYGARLGGGV